MTLQALAFDLDGTLIDSEPVWHAAEREVMAWLGGPWGTEHEQITLGGSLYGTSRYMIDLAGADVPVEVVGRRMLDFMVLNLPTELEIIPGAKQLLTEAAAQGVPVALVTSTFRELAEIAIDALGRDLFAVTITGDEVDHTKPHPDPYLKACRLLGAEPGRTVALEDSPTGVAAAEAAGCRVVAIPNVVPIPDGPSRTVVPALTELSLDRLRSLVPPS
ncbi:HAD family phosphatase [Actinocorallia sp. API 0066]|uniref:HAD family hydrolase n=1 Tax=Actinocorallia sp. API 0066 TaxID=2896846 RepID=UPI001E4BF95E|nr:HAD family phosphatase [Actinocorallia sp. API 0066]MCD0450125.1 HAD family phosphatase [Actinocorallia sp. API 0066]